MKRRIAAIVFAIAFVFAGTIGVSAEYAEVEVIDSDGLFALFNTGYVGKWSVGSSKPITNYSFGFYSLIDLQADALYEFHVVLHTSTIVSSFDINNLYFAVTSTLPNNISAFNTVNSSGVAINELITCNITMERESSTSFYYTFDFFFSTADGFVDIFSPGNNYISLIFKNAWSSSLSLTNLSISVNAYEDAGGDLYQSFVMESLDYIINNQQTIIHYGQGNALPTDSGIGAAQESLHNAESTLKNKQQSLFSRASAGITTAITASQTHVSALAAPVAAVASNVGTAMEQLPSEVQAGFVAMPLVGLAAWLIGLKR